LQSDEVIALRDADDDVRIQPDARPARADALECGIVLLEIVGLEAALAVRGEMPFGKGGLAAVENPVAERSGR
jgi:hypothetical protein